MRVPVVWCESDVDMMEQKHVLLSALSVGVGVGLGLVSGQTLGRWTGASASASSAAAGISADELQLELLRLVVDGDKTEVTFEDFPYYIRSISTNISVFFFFSYKKDLFIAHKKKLCWQCFLLVCKCYGLWSLL